MLHERQKNFVRAVLQGPSANDVPHESLKISGGKLSAEARISIYRRNVFSTLRSALGDIFPTAKKILGDALFFKAADFFIVETPSPSGDLNQFGREWPEFLKQFLNQSTKQFLPSDSYNAAPDMARLDWAWHESFHAAEADAFDLARLGSVPAERHGELVFILHPSARLIQSAHPLFAIWLSQQEDRSVEQPQQGVGEEPKKGDFLLVHRANADVTITRLGAAEYGFLSHCAEGHTLTASVNAALAIDAAFDLQDFLIQSVRQKAIINFVDSNI